MQQGAQENVIYGGYLEIVTPAPLRARVGDSMKRYLVLREDNVLYVYYDEQVRNEACARETCAH